MSEFIHVYEKSMSDKVCVIEVGGENNPTSPVYTKMIEIDEAIPVSIYESYHMNINKVYYEQNKQEIESLIIDVLKITKEETICLVPTELFTDSVIETINSNDNIKKIAFWGMAKVNKDLLSKDLINSMSLYGYFNLLDLIEKKETVFIHKYIPNEELSKLKILFEKYPAKTVIISSGAVSQINELLPIIKADKIVINDINMYHFEQKEYFSVNAAVNEVDSQTKECLSETANYNQTIKNIENSYASVIKDYDNVEFVFNDYGNVVGSINIKMKNMIYDAIVSEVRQFKLTPLEAYLYFYDVVKLFREYKKEPSSEKSDISRRSEFLLFNDYIVCAGYTRVLIELVDRYNDPNLMAAEYLCYIGNEGFHSRSITKIKDDKYSVAGMYISDITADSKKSKLDLFLDRLDCFLMTKQEVDKYDKRTKDSIPDCTDVMFYNQNGYNESANDFPTYAWDNAHYICWKFYNMSERSSIRSFYLSDPLEIRQTALSEDVILSAKRKMHAKTFSKDSNSHVRFIKRLRWIRHLLTFSTKLQDKLKYTNYEFESEGKKVK